VAEQAGPLQQWLIDQLSELRSTQRLRSRRVVRIDVGGRVVIDGHECWDFASNDYLGLSTDPRVVAAATPSQLRKSSGARASALVCGRGPEMVELETCLARFEHQPAAVLFPSGMAANMGTVSALVRPNDVVFCDRFNHASLVDGCRLSRARLRVYRHDRLEQLAERLSREPVSARRWIVTDTVFSMDGDLAPLRELTTLAERYGAALIADEAHGTGVWGLTGRGVAEHLGVEDRIAVRIGTLSKSLGALGGFVTGAHELIEYLWSTARTQVYSTALPPAVCAAAAEAVRILAAEPWRIPRLHERCSRFRHVLAEAGVTVYPNSRGPIVPILLEDETRTLEAASQLQQKGFLVGAIRPPTVPQGTARLRITVTLSPPDEVLPQLAAALSDIVHHRR
jgi:8-amino-7-oxononanoate synthase